MQEFDEQAFRQGLSQFHGGDPCYRHNINTTVVFTCGAKYVADQCGAYWLLDEIAINQMLAVIANETFQVWKLVVNNRPRAHLICEDGNDNVVFLKDIEFTDFPLNAFELWHVQRTILLPSEY